MPEAQMVASIRLEVNVGKEDGKTRSKLAVDVQMRRRCWWHDDEQRNRRMMLESTKRWTHLNQFWSGQTWADATGDCTGSDTITLTPNNTHTIQKQC